MRQWGFLALACAAVAGCGDGTDEAGKAKARAGGELTVTLPPTLPSEPQAAEPAPQAGFEAIAEAEPALKAPPALVKTQPRAPAPEEDERPAQVEVAVAPAAEAPAAAAGGAAAEPATPEAPAPTATAPAAGATAWAGYLRRAGFPCQRIASANRIERSASPGFQYYKVDCAGGGSYQATNKRGHLYFRRWRG